MPRRHTDLSLHQVYVIHPGTDRYLIADRVEALPLSLLADLTFEWGTIW